MTLPFGWRRRPPWNCPLCKGKGEILWTLHSSTPPDEYVCIGRRKPKPGRKKGTLILAESVASQDRREAWMDDFAYYKYDCACVRMLRLDYHVLKKVAAQMNRVRHKEGIPQHSLDDSVDDMFQTPVAHVLEYIKAKAHA